MRAVVILLGALLIGCYDSSGPQVHALPIRYGVAPLPADSPHFLSARVVGDTGFLTASGTWITTPNCGYNPTFRAFIRDQRIHIHLYPTTTVPSPICFPGSAEFLWVVEADSLPPSTYVVDVYYPYVAGAEIVIATDTVVVH